MTTDAKNLAEKAHLAAVLTPGRSSIQGHVQLNFHNVPHHMPNHVQVSLLIAYIAVFTVWLIRTCLYYFNIRVTISPFRNCFGSSESSSPDDKSAKNKCVAIDIEKANGYNSSKDVDAETAQRLLTSDNQAASVDLSKSKTQNGFIENLNERHSHSAVDQPGDKGEKSCSNSDTSTHKGDAKNKGSEPTKAPVPASGPPPVTFDAFLNSFVLFGAIMIYFFFCDYWKFLPQGKGEYSRDVFLFLVFIFFLVASAFTIKDNPDKILNRDQTEEWKGWMQVMFVWYHYFKAKEWYNWIRVYIACYVWMTGFGNFSFFWIRKDFSLWRMIKMLFRLNFLVIFVAMVTGNEYMLYYICAMHTYWFLTVYVFMRVLNSWNTDRIKMAIKFGAYFVCNFIIFDIPGVTEKFFRPVQFILGCHDGWDDILHEWTFRAGLDHWACFVGMLCAYNYPHFESLMAYLDAKSVSSQEQIKKLGIRIGLGITALAAGVVWYFTCMRKDKYAYNAQHSYTSPVPILVFIVLRNIHPMIRVKHIGMFAWLGKITLETYLSQLHVYLMANARTLLMYIPNYTLLNFSLATIIYLVISHTLFNITNTTSNFLIPRDRKQMLINFVCVIALFGLSSLLAYGVVL